jgi:L-rhamnose mutarotase
MEKYAWKATIKDGYLDEYIRRHDNLPEDMKKVLHDAGICNYTIWNVGNELFGYYECKNCHHKFVPTYKEALFVMHTPTKRHLKCPKCNKKSWNKKVLSKYEN